MRQQNTLSLILEAERERTLQFVPILCQVKQQPHVICHITPVLQTQNFQFCVSNIIFFFYMIALRSDGIMEMSKPVALCIISNRMTYMGHRLWLAHFTGV